MVVMSASAHSLIARALQNTEPPPAEAIDLWRTLAKRDVEAAFALVNDNHLAI
jgi:hypothetical protein